MPDLSPAFKTRAWSEWAKERTLVHDFAEGTRAIRRKSAEYLPKHISESPEAWHTRVNNAVVLGTVSRAISVSTGLVVRHAPQPHPDLPEWLDLAAATKGIGGLTQTVSQVAHALIADSWCAIWVDNTEDGDQRWQIIEADDVLGLEQENGRAVAVRIFRTRTTVDPKDWTEAHRDEVWAMRMVPDSNLANVDRWTRQQGVSGGKWVRQVRQTVTLPQPYLPIAIAAFDKRFQPARPPLLDLAYELHRYTRIRTDHDAHLEIASCPIWVATGVDDDTFSFEVGAGLGIKLQTHQADAKVLELAGDAIGASRQELLDTERRMALMSLALIERHVRGAESAESRKIDEAQASAALRTIGRACEQAVTEAVNLHAAWSRGAGAVEDVPDSPVTIAVSQASQPLSGPELKILMEAVTLDLLSKRAWLEALERAEILPQGAAADEEQAAAASDDDPDGTRTFPGRNTPLEPGLDE